MSDDRKIVLMADLRNDALLVTPELALRDALQEFDVGRWKNWPKVLVIALGFTQSRMKCSEMLALLKVFEAKLLVQMGFLSD